MKLIVLILFVLCFFNGFSLPGRVLIVGGGTEKNGPNSWSTPAYRWAGEGKKVAIVGTSTGSLAPYFVAFCNAASAKEFAIATFDSANSQATYDTLTSYDVIFFRGGDQYEYYNLYKNSRLLDAVNFVYNRGGTICGTSAGMHILSSVVFTARYGSAYPDECIENPNNQYVTLANDFLQLFPGYIFDTHFAERARFGRLTGFLANYWLNRGAAITGIGLDDYTCMTIDETGLGTVYGTGCANLYLAGTGYSLNGTKLLADTLNIVQLLQGCTYNFQTGQIGYSSLDQQINTSSLEESGNYTVLASGSDLLTDNLAMLTNLVQFTGTPSSPILLLSGDQPLAGTFSNKLIESGASQVYIFNPVVQSGSDPILGDRILNAGKILFLKNNDQDFLNFLGTQNGKLLQQRVRTDSTVSAFVGDNARFAGKTIVGNYLTEYASWYGELTFSRGLSLLRHTVIMPNTYLSSDMYENTATAVPYAMLKDTLKYGIWLTNHNFMKYAPVSGKALLTGFGNAPVMVIANAGARAGFSSHNANGSGTTPPRMVAGFEALKLSLIDETTPYMMGVIQQAGVGERQKGLAFFLSPNPVDDQLTLTCEDHPVGWSIVDLTGKVLMCGETTGPKEQIDISQLSRGIYFIEAITDQFGLAGSRKFVKN